MVPIRKKGSPSFQSRDLSPETPTKTASFLSYLCGCLVAMNEHIERKKIQKDGSGEIAEFDTRCRTCGRAKVRGASVMSLVTRLIASS